MNFRIGIVIGIIFVGMILQFITSPKNVSTVPYTQNFVHGFNPPKDVEILLQKSCFDCHSNNTAYPWYAEIQPIGMLLANHISEGKEKLNFDELKNLGKRQQRSRFTGIIEQIEQNKMPLKSYLFMHKDAALSEKNKKVLTSYFEILKSQ
ncbi:heme-binding domain-containing protein [Chryseobacterium koreense]|nr:heme-binding domain-containing protein [Chryseobacterium koreense]MBB5334430.1 hypothetical protein [Chryseobacterium koreense]